MDGYFVIMQGAWTPNMNAPQHKLISTFKMEGDNVPVLFSNKTTYLQPG